MSAMLNKLVRIFLIYSEKLHANAEQLKNKASEIERSKHGHHPQAKSGIEKLRHNAHLFAQASLHLRHAASEISQVRQ
jgi:hypothetical protein